MDDQNPAELLPGLYRAVLDTIARLERVGDRKAAYDIREKALRTYSRRWDERGRQALERLDRSARARLESHPRSASIALSRSSEPA